MRIRSKEIRKARKREENRIKLEIKEAKSAKAAPTSARARAPKKAAS
jgi:hypothetical protein